MVATLQKVAKRIGNARLDKLLLKFAGNRSNLQEWVLIVLGLSFGKLRVIILKGCSIKLKKKKRREGVGDRKNLKSKSSNTQPLFQMWGKQLILGAKSSRGPKSDCKTLIPAFNKIEPIFQNQKRLRRQRTCDSEYNFKHIAETIGAEPVIKLKNKDIPVNRTKGEYRKKAKRKRLNPIGRSRKNHRNITETMFSVVKRKIGSRVNAIKPFMQRSENSSTKQ